MPKNADECSGCKSRDERIRVLEQLVSLHQQEMARRRNFEAQVEMLIGRANELQEEVESDGGSADGDGPAGKG